MMSNISSQLEDMDIEPHLNIQNLSLSSLQQVLMNGADELERRYSSDDDDRRNVFTTIILVRSKIFLLGNTLFQKSPNLSKFTPDRRS